MTGITVDNISLEIDGNEILKNVSISLNRGEMIGLVGPNGAGKSSLLKCMLGLHEKYQGEIFIDGKDVSEFELKERAKMVAYAAQGAPVHWPLTVEHIVGLGRIPYLNPWQRMGDNDQNLINEAMKKTDCLHLKDRSVTSLSGGERARVLLARTLATNAAYIMADEPIASLDPAHQLQVMNILKKLSRTECGVMVVMHDLSLALRYCDQVILLNDGCLIEQGDPDKVLSNDNLKKVFSISASRGQVSDEKYLITHPIDKGTN